jgi:RNA polymerase sigma-70 factor (ECF subfamily)
MAAPRIPAVSGDPPPPAEADAWLAGFHRGDPDIIERCYRDHFEVVEAAIRQVLVPADRETVIHEVFWRLLSNPELRRSFRGGSMAAWLATVTRNLAIDYLRRLTREVALPAEDSQQPVPALDGQADARLLLEQFQRQRLPAAWWPVFDLRFLRQLSQREAAAALRIRRTTLAYRELRIRQALRAFLMEDES